MGRERKSAASDKDINHALDLIEEGADTIAERIHETLQIDGETHPTRGQVIEEIKKIHAGRRKREPQDRGRDTS